MFLHNLCSLYNLPYEKLEHNSVLSEVSTVIILLQCVSGLVTDHMLVNMDFIFFFLKINVKCEKNNQILSVN